MNFTPYILVLFTSLLFVSCSSNPQIRIKKNPEIYQSLSPEHQELVSLGKIEEGMRKQAVFLALGEPSTRAVVSKEKKVTEAWYYNVLQPVYAYHLGSSYGHGGFRGGFGRSRRGFRGGFGGGRRGFRGGFRGGFGSSFHFGPSVYYTSRRGSAVYFNQDEVTGWATRN